MSLESWTEGMLDKSFFARAIRKSTAKSVVLGWLDAMQNPNAVLSQITGENAETGAAPEKALPPAPSHPAGPVPLPRPKLIAHPRDEPTDEPDKPGVPPRHVRKQKKQPPSTGASAAAEGVTQPVERTEGEDAR